MKIHPLRLELFPECIDFIGRQLTSLSRPLQVLVIADGNFEVGPLAKSLLTKQGHSSARVLCAFEQIELVELAKNRQQSSDENLKFIVTDQLLQSAFSELRFDMILVDYRTLNPQKNLELIKLKKLLTKEGFFSSLHAPLKYLNNHIILIGSSTGGTSVIKELLYPLPPWSPPILIVQHMPDKGTLRFAQSLNEQCLLQVQELNQSTRLRFGHVYIAKAGLHMRLTEVPEGMPSVEVFDGPLKNNFKPSVDVLFESACQEIIESKLLGIILTGMGVDGAAGLLKIRQNKGETWAQDEKTCAVFGMPKAAIDLGAVKEIYPPALMLQNLTDDLY